MSRSSLATEVEIKRLKIEDLQAENRALREALERIVEQGGDFFGPGPLVVIAQDALSGERP